MSKCVFVTVCLCLAVLAGCGSGGTSDPTNLGSNGSGSGSGGATTLTVAPSNTRVLVGGTQQFTASEDVVWAVNSVAGGNDIVGTISSAGLYQAPNIVPFNPVITIKATSEATGSVGSVQANLGGLTGNRFAYVASASANSIQTFTADAGTGKLQQTSTFTLAAGTAPTALAASPNGAFPMSLNRGSNDIANYAIDAATGNLSSAGAVSVPSRPYAMVFSSTGDFAYVSCDGASTVAAFAFSVASGALTPLSDGSYVATSGKIQSLTISPDGKFLYTVNRDANQIIGLAIAADGSLSSIAGSPFAAQPGLSSIALNTGNYSGDYQFLYASSENGIEAYDRDVRSGALTYLPSATQTDAGNSPKLFRNVSDGVLVAVNPQSGGAFSHVFDYLALPPGALSPGGAPVSTGTSPVAGGWLWSDSGGTNWVYVLNRQADPTSATGSIGVYHVDHTHGLGGPAATISTDSHDPTGFVVTP